MTVSKLPLDRRMLIDLEEAPPIPAVADEILDRAVERVLEAADRTDSRALSRAEFALGLLVACRAGAEHQACTS